MASVKFLYGPMLFGVYLNMILYGILIVQTYDYIRGWKKDAVWIRCLVVYLFIAETANTALDMHTMYEPLIMRFGTPEATKFIPTSFASEPIMNVLVSMPIQLFFAWRVKVLTRSYLLATIIIIFAITSFAGGVWTTYKTAMVRLFIHKNLLEPPALVWLLGSCVADIFITTVLVISLAKRRTGIGATDDVISKIIRMTIQTGLLTALFAVADVAFFMTLHHATINFIFDIALVKLYANCLLSTLNAREHWREQSQLSSNQSKRIRMTSMRSNAIDSNDAVLDLEGQKQTYKSPYSGRDVEIGIAVTKVVD